MSKSDDAVKQAAKKQEKLVGTEEQPEKRVWKPAARGSKKSAAAKVSNKRKRPAAADGAPPQSKRAVPARGGRTTAAAGRAAEHAGRRDAAFRLRFRCYPAKD